MVEVHKVNGGGPTHEGNVYLILDEVPALIDAGMDAKATIKNIEKLIDPRRIEFIILTHCHHDHTAGIPALKEATGAKVLIGEGRSATSATTSPPALTSTRRSRQSSGSMGPWRRGTS